MIKRKERLKMIDWKKMINDHNKEFNGKCLDDPNPIMFRVKLKTMICLYYSRVIIKLLETI